MAFDWPFRAFQSAREGNAGDKSVIMRPVLVTTFGDTVLDNVVQSFT